MEQILSQIQQEYGEKSLVFSKQYLSITNKLVKTNERMRFLMKCKSTDLVPRFISDKLNFFETLENGDHPFKNNIRNMRNIVSNKLLKMEIRICDHKLKKLNIEKKKHVNQLSKNIDTTLCNELIRQQDGLNKNLHRNLSQSIGEKLGKLMKNQRIFVDTDEKMFKNLTDIEVPYETTILLSFGSKFALPTKTRDIPLIKILSEVENILAKLHEDKVVEQRGKITNMITNFLKKPQKLSKVEKTLSYYQKVTKKFLKDHKNIVITKSDKGGTTVVMFKSDYQQKMMDLLQDESTYERIFIDPTSAVNKEVKSIINKLERNQKIESKFAKLLIIEDPVAPKAYGLPKTHKPGIPIRPIVSTIGSPCYKISKYLCSILKPMTLNSQYNIKNSFCLKEQLDKMVLGQDDVLVSFDVVSLFTNIPLQLAREIIIKKWDKLTDNNIELNDFLLLFDVCATKNNYFQYDQQLYRQRDGLAMGNPLSPILADIVMGDLFEQKMTCLPKNPTFMFKYVDDIILAIPEVFVEESKIIFEDYNPKIKFTIEREINGQLPFLEMKLYRRREKITTGIVKKRPRIGY